MLLALLQRTLPPKVTVRDMSYSGHTVWELIIDRNREVIRIEHPDGNQLGLIVVPNSNIEKCEWNGFHLTAVIWSSVQAVQVINRLVRNGISRVKANRPSSWIFTQDEVFSLVLT